MTDAKTRVAIIGAGIGREHLAGYLELPTIFEVRVLCDIDHQRAQEVVQQQAISIETEFETVLKDDSIDLVDICLPPHLHFDAIMSALSAGKSVICEKPLVTSLNEVDRIIEAAKESGQAVFPVFQYRFGNAMAQLRSLMQAGIAGKPYVASLETHWNRGADYYAVPWRGTWRGEQGGAVLGHAIHSHDLLASIFGPIEKVFASATTRVNDIETEDCASIILQMKNGAVATSSITLGAATDTSRLRFCFEGLTAESGTLPYAPMADTWQFTARDPVQQADVDAIVEQAPKVLSGFSGFLESVARGLNDRSLIDHGLMDHDPVARELSDGRRQDNGQQAQTDASSATQNSGNALHELPVTLAQARHSIELVNAIYQSAEFDRSVTLPLNQKDIYYNGWVPAR